MKMNEKNNLDNKDYTSVLFQEKYYMDRISSYLILFVASVIVIIFLIFNVGYIYLTKPKSQYFVTSTSGQIFASATLDKKIYSEPQVIDWAAQAAIQLYNFNFLNYKSEILSMSNYFTDAGFEAFKKDLASAELPTILDGKFSIKLSLCDIGSVNKNKSASYNVDGIDKYVWYISLPVYFEYQNNKNKYTVVANMDMQIMRMSELNYLSGLAINAISISNRTNLAQANISSLPVCSYSITYN